MDISNQNRMIITDDEGQEKEVQIILTFESDDYGKKYVIFLDPDDDENVYVFGYDDEGNLIEIEDKKEMEMAEEVWEAYQDEQEDEE